MTPVDAFEVTDFGQALAGLGDDEKSSITITDGTPTTAADRADARAS